MAPYFAAAKIIVLLFGGEYTFSAYALWLITRLQALFFAGCCITALSAFRKIRRFAGNESKNINKSVAVGFLNAVLQMFGVAAIYFIVLAITSGENSVKPALIALVCEIVAIFGGAVSASFSKMFQTHAGYFMAADSRISIANRLKSVPMGFFKKNSLGQVSGVFTTVIGSIESWHLWGAAIGLLRLLQALL